jgi:hypothetical protein
MAASPQRHLAGALVQFAYNVTAVRPVGGPANP